MIEDLSEEVPDSDSDTESTEEPEDKSVIQNVFEPEPEPVIKTDKSVTEIAHEVLAGKWGRGNIRKKRLHDAGYDADEVSAEISKIINR